MKRVQALGPEIFAEILSQYPLAIPYIYEGAILSIQAPSPDANTAAIHMSLMGKGGVGKTLTASVLAQYFIDRGARVTCIDADPVNKTFCQYEALSARPLQLLCDGAINPRVFDTLMEELLTQDGLYVVDNGASTFVPLWHYMLENDIIRLLRNSGKKLFVHTVVTGGQALADTLSGLSQIASTTPDQNVVVWINEFFGRVEREGKRFEEMKTYTDHQAKICGVVAIPRRNYDTFGRDVEELIAQKLTFEHAIRNGNFSIVSKQRLKMVQRDLFEQLRRLPF